MDFTHLLLSLITPHSNFTGKQPIKNSVAVLPEVYKDPINQCAGVCSDYISKYV